MKLCFRILAVAIVAASTYSLLSCAAPASPSYQNVTLAVSAQCSDCENSGTFVFFNPAYPLPPLPGSVPYMPPGGGQGGDTLFTVTVNNAPATNVTWTIYPTPNLGSIDNLPTGTSIPVGESGSSVGTIVAASGATALYSAPSGPPVYSGAARQQAEALGIPQGDVLLVVSVPNDPGNPSSVATYNQLIQILPGTTSAPNPFLQPHTNTSPAGLTVPAVTVPRNGTFQFYGGVVGALPCASAVICATEGFTALYSTDNASLWEVCAAPFALSTCLPPVNGVSGNATLGTITQTGTYTALYTAPAAIPNPLPVVLVTSHLSPTVTNTGNYAYIGIN